MSTSLTTIDRAPATLSVAVSAGPGRECLSFRLGAEEYGIDILSVQEIRSYEVPTRIAGASEVMSGVLNLRGVIVPIFDLRQRLGLPAAFDASTVTVVLNLGGRTVGAVVDSVSDVMELSAEQIKPAPAFNGQINAAYITGLGCIPQEGGQRMLILLDAEQLLEGLLAGLDPMSMTTTH